jgi:two-component system response regulator
MPKKVIRVMIVEDHDATAYLIKRAFGDRSARVDWDLSFARDGEEALNYLFRRGVHKNAARPEIILLDLNLPKVSGHEVLRVLKSSDELITVPVLVFSSSQENEVVQTAYRSHANSYICKPSDFASFCTVVESLETFWVHTARLPAKWITEATLPT